LGFNPLRIIVLDVSTGIALGFKWSYFKHYPQVGSGDDRVDSQLPPPEAVA